MNEFLNRGLVFYSDRLDEIILISPTGLGLGLGLAIICKIDEDFDESVAIVATTDAAAYAAMNNYELIGEL